MLELQNYYCDKCHEKWPTSHKFCSTCKSTPDKFTNKNDMVPNHDSLDKDTKLAFEKLTMIEEQLISPAFAMMSVYRLPGGQHISKGFLINFFNKLFIKIY